MRETSAYMAKDRPDLYTHELALAELTQVIEDLRTGTKNFNILMFSSYVFIRMVQEDVEDFLFTRKVAGMLLDHDEEKVGIYGYTRDVNLPYIGDMEAEDFGMDGESESLDDDDDL
jgi:hypothetical protein